MSFYKSRCWVDIPRNMSISELMLQNVDNTLPEKVIYEEAATGKTSTYSSFHRHIRRTAWSLQQRLGLRPGQIVSIISSSSIDYILTAQSVWWADAVVSPISNSLHPDEIRHSIDIIEPDYLVVDAAASHSVQDILKASTHHSYRPIEVLTLGHICKYWPEFPIDRSSAPTDGLELVSPVGLHGRDSHLVCAAILLSSGTTGYPKAVMLSHYNLVACCYQLRYDNPQNWRGTQREIFFAPLSHVYALYVCFNMCCWLGSYVCLMPRFDVERYCQLMQDRAATLARIVPPVAKILAENPVVGQYSYPQLEYFSCAAAPLPIEIIQKLKRVFPGVAICQTYGCTELTGPCVQSGVRDARMPASASGTLIANTKIRFLDHNGQDVGCRGPGEITCHGPNVMMMYKGNTKETAQSLTTDGWYRTGDLGYIDDNGFLHVYDRIKDTIKYKGLQVSPSELEKIIVKHPGVDEAAVIGVWYADESTEVPRAFVTLSRQGSNCKEHETIRSIVRFVAKHVSKHKKLRGGVVPVAALPKNATGKVLKNELRQWSQKAMQRGTIHAPKL